MNNFKNYIPFVIILIYSGLLNFKPETSKIDLAIVLILGVFGVAQLIMESLKAPDYRKEIIDQLQDSKKELEKRIATLEKDNEEVKSKFNAMIGSKPMSGIVGQNIRF